jgi:two-component system, NtrC family, sensor histidine kinase HydH
MSETEAERDQMDAATATIVRRTNERYDRYRRRTVADTDRLFAWLLLVEWALAVVVAVVVSPYAWTGRAQVVHFHVWVALLLGGVIASVPAVLATRRAGDTLTRHVVAAAQMLMSALFVHLSGGRIETHFHVFCSLAVLAFYLDPLVLLTAAVVVAGEHFVRGIVWPESVYGMVNPEWWRFGEHAFWVVLCVSLLTYSCRRHLREWRAAAEEGGLIEAMAEAEWRKGSVLDREKTSAAAEAE